MFIAVVPVLLYSFVGIELPSTAGEEMVDPRRDIPVAIGRAGVGQLLMYAVPILAVLVVLPAEQITSLHGLIDAMKTVFTVYGGIGRRRRHGDADRRRARARLGRRGGVHLGAARERVGVDHGRRAGAGGGVPRRRRARASLGRISARPACRS